MEYTDTYQGVNHKLPDIKSRGRSEMLEAKTWAAIEELQNENTKLKASLAEKEAEMTELREKVRPLLDWVETRTKPNRQHYYSRCVVCNATWWDKKENHNIRCFVPALRAAVEIRNPPGTSE